MISFHAQGAHARPQQQTGRLAQSAYNLLAKTIFAWFCGPANPSFDTHLREAKSMNAFNVRKAAQVTAYFALRDGGSIDVLKLAKLTYLAERECLDEYELPLTGDAAVAMPHGPALTNTLDHVNGYAREDAEWNRLIADRAGFRIGIASKDISLQSLRGLSDADRELLGRVWDRYGHLDGFALRDLTHAMCKEWTDPLGSSRPITYSEILVALGKDDVPSILETIEISNAMRPPNAPTAGRAHAQSA